MTTAPNTSKQKNIPTWKGTVVSNRMKNTVVVAVETLKTHPKYKKQYQATKRVIPLHYNLPDYWFVVKLRQKD
jgi:ribosomal protein S17